MSVVSRTQMRRATELLNPTERPLLLWLGDHGRSWIGTVATLEEGMGIPSARIWKAIGNLANRHLVMARRLPDETLELKITGRGRQLAARVHNEAP
jgi:DNA-binding MarR family transcriptional regulator